MEISQAEWNYAEYTVKYRDELEKEHWGRIVLMHDGEVVEIYNDRGDAYSIGCEKYGLGHFSLQEIGEQPAQLGIITAALQ